MARQYALFSLPTPVFVNEIGTKQEVVFTTFLDETIAATPTSPDEDNRGGGYVAHGSHFSRKRWRELQDAIAAERALEAKAKQATGERKIALEEAAQVAEQAIAAVEDKETTEHSAELVKLTRMMEAATAASKAAKAISLANAAYAYAVKMKAEQDDEEDAIAVLLS